MLFVVDGHDAVDDDVFDPERKLVRLLERRPIDDASGIEDRDVGGKPVLQAPAILDADLVGVHARHLLHGVGQRDGLQFADVAPEHARERAVVAGVRVGPAGRAIGVDRAPVGSDRRPRLLQDQLHVRLGVMEEDRGDAAVLLDQHVEQHIGGMAAARRDQLAHAPALERSVSFVFERDRIMPPQPSPVAR